MPNDIEIEDLVQPSAEEIAASIDAHIEHLRLEVAFFIKLRKRLRGQEVGE